jgi:hypothetical protein
MPKPGEPFSATDLAELFSVADEVPHVWWENGEGPDYFERQTPHCVTRFSTAEAVRAFVLKHRVAPGARGPSDRAGPVILGGFLPVRL